MSGLAEAQIDFKDSDQSGAAPIFIADKDDASKRMSVLAPGDTVASRNGLLLLGSDGTNVRSLLTNTAGRLQVDVVSGGTSGQQVADGDAATGGDPANDFGTIAAGWDGTNYQFVSVNSLGRLQVDVIGGGGTSGLLVEDGDVIAGGDVGRVIVGSDGTNYQFIKTDADGNLQIDVLSLPTVTVQATDLDIRDLTHASDSVKIGDGTNLAAITASGNRLKVETVPATGTGIAQVVNLADPITPSQMASVTAAGRVLVSTEASVPESLEDLAIDYVKNGGSSDLRVNGSGTPVVFTYEADPTNDILLQEITFISSSNGVVTDGLHFLSQAALTNGILVEIVSNGTTSTLSVLKLSEEVYEFGSNVFINSTGSDFTKVTLSLGGSVRLYAGTSDEVRVTIRDNMTAAAYKYLKFRVLAIRVA